VIFSGGMEFTGNFVFPDVANNFARIEIVIPMVFWGIGGVGV